MGVQIEIVAGSTAPGVSFVEECSVMAGIPSLSKLEDPEEQLTMPSPERFLELADASTTIFWNCPTHPLASNLLDVMLSSFFS